MNKQRQPTREEQIIRALALEEAARLAEQMDSGLFYAALCQRIRARALAQLPPTLVAVERAVLEQAINALPRAGFPKCDRRCASVAAAHDESPVCDCGWGEIREIGALAIAALQEALR